MSKVISYQFFTPENVIKASLVSFHSFLQSIWLARPLWKAEIDIMASFHCLYSYLDVLLNARYCYQGVLYAPNGASKPLDS